MDTVLSERIRTILKEQNLKQTQLAAALGVSVNYICLLANGRKKNVSLSLAKLIESLYGYSAQWIMTGEKEPDNTEVLRQKALDKIMDMNESELLRLKEFIKSE